ncbi:MAG: hypothetical protein JO016_12080 [Actinobacteria bacterium]|nr:hypothetical protein [Actinomycetota bacterium]
MDTAEVVTELSTINRSAGVSDATAKGAGEDERVEIGRYAARLAAFERTVLPVAERQLDDGGTRAGQLREGGEQLNTVLHWLDRHLTGDVRARTWPGDDLAQDVESAVSHYSDMERGLIDELTQALSDADLTELVKSYHRAEQGAPTRPHPKLSYDGPLGGLKFRLAALVDDVRDGTESRPAGPVVGAEAAQALHDLDADTDQADAAQTAAGQQAAEAAARGEPAIEPDSKPTGTDS